MKCLKVVLVLVAFYILSVEGVLLSTEDGPGLTKLPHQPAYSIKETKISENYDEHSESLISIGQFISLAKSAFHRYLRCPAKMRTELSASRYNFTACVAATQAIADYEQFFIDLYNYTKFVDKSIVSILKDVIDCHKVGDGFEVLKCVLTSIENDGPVFDEITKQALGLVTELQAKTERLVDETKKCLGLNKIDLFLVGMYLLNNDC